MLTNIPRRTGRPPRRAETGTNTTITIRIPAETKNLLIDMADGYDMTIADYITLLATRDAAQP